MSRTHHRRDFRIRVVGIQRQTPDLERLARALISLARRQAEDELPVVEPPSSGHGRALDDAA